ncbi:MAG: lipase maturation factor family protein, partial [Myxococcota bacterium]
HHFATQPLPTVPGWYAAHLPLALDRIGCALMFGVELGLPFLIFVPRRAARRTAAAGFAGLMASIALTGNYGFFNLLTLVLAASLVDDDVWARFVPGRRVCSRAPSASPARRARLGHALATLLAGLGMLGFVYGLGGRRLAPSSDPLAALRPFRSLNDYGLFAVMTTHRREIELEGSHDGRDWKAIRFRFKVGPLDRAPVWCAPHQPRLDWQMWFAALDPAHPAPWLERLMEGLVTGDEAMLGLLADDPLPGPPPRFVRAALWEYRPTDLAQHARTGDWWTRERLGPYGVPVIRGERDGT